MNRESFIAGVRARLAGVEVVEADVPKDWAVTVDERPARFAEELAGSAGSAYIGLPAAAPLLERIAGETVLVTGDAGIPGEVSQRAGRVLHWPVSREQVAAVTFGVTSAMWAVAETGSVVVSSAPPGGRAPSLLPPVHIVFLPVDRLLATTVELFCAVAALDAPPSNLVVITGPSKSADIGQELSVGVHGPRELHVVLL